MAYDGSPAFIISMSPEAEALCARDMALDALCLDEDDADDGYPDPYDAFDYDTVDDASLPSDAWGL